jgi:hypothetical protein
MTSQMVHIGRSLADEKFIQSKVIPVGLLGGDDGIHAGNLYLMLK